MTKDDWTTIGRIPRNSTDEWMIKTGRYWNIDVVDIDYIVMIVQLKRA